MAAIDMAAFGYIRLTDADGSWNGRLEWKMEWKIEIEDCHGRHGT